MAGGASNAALPRRGASPVVAHCQRRDSVDPLRPIERRSKATPAASNPAAAAASATSSPPIPSMAVNTSALPRSSANSRPASSIWPLRRAWRSCQGSRRRGLSSGFGAMLSVPSYAAKGQRDSALPAAPASLRWPLAIADLVAMYAVTSRSRSASRRRRGSTSAATVSNARRR